MNAERLTDAVTLYEGDCREVLPKLVVGDIECVIADPPYGMGWDTDTTRFSGGHNPGQRSAGRNDRKRVLGDDQPFDPSQWVGFKRVALFGANHFAHLLPVGSWLVWLKRNDEAFGSFLSDAELVWVKRGCGVYCHRDLSMNAITKERDHPTQKPVGLMRWVVRKVSQETDTILDPFAGSGTTAIAAMLEGRRCILIEKDPAYCEVIRRRVRECDQTGPQSLFRDVPTLFAEAAL